MFPFIPNPIDLVTAPFRWGLGALKAAGGGVIKDAFNWLCGLLLSGVAWLFTVVWNFVSTATTPNLYASWFVGGPFAVMRTLATAVLMFAVLLAIGEAVWNRSGSGLLRSVAQDFPKAVFWLTSLLFITTIGLGIADAASDWLMGMFNNSATNFATAMSDVASKLQFGAGLLVVILAALLMMLVLVLVAVGFAFREGFIFFLVAITAVAVCLDVYRPTKGAGGQAMRMLIGVIIAKPIVALCFALGGGMIGGTGTAPQSTAPVIAEPGTPAATAAPSAVPDPAGENSDDLTATFGTLLAGMATIMLAAVTPIAVLKLVPGVHATAAHEGQSAVTAKVKSTATQAASKVAGML